MTIIPKPIHFEWDKGNSNKNWKKHNLTNDQCEEPFFGTKRKIFEDTQHSDQEERFLLFGKTKQEKFLLISFTIRNQRVRIISARAMHKKEKAFYEKATQIT